MRMKESEALEFKKTTSELKEAVISICAMLNKHKKGEVYFGVTDSGKIIEQEIGKDTLRDISREIHEKIEPKIYPVIEEVNIDGKKCIHVAFEGNDTPYLAYGRAYKRVADRDLLMTRKEYEAMILEKNKGKIRWDAQFCPGAGLSDIDRAAIQSFKRYNKESKRIPIENEGAEQILMKLKLIRNGKLTNAAIILFGKKPRKFFNNAIVKCGRFRGAGKEFIDMKDFEGNLFDSLDKILSFFKEHLRVSARIEGIIRKEKLEIPLEALREAVINALIHRDYFDTGFTYIKIHDDKVIIANPGSLPEKISIKDLFKEHESKPRNPLLASTFYYTGLIDAWGHGIQNIITALKKENLPLPEFEQSAGSFRIIFKRKIEKNNVKKIMRDGTLNGTLNDDTMLLLKVIGEREGINASNLSKLLSRPIDTVKKQIRKLTEKGLIERRGSRKTGGFEVIVFDKKAGGVTGGVTGGVNLYDFIKLNKGLRASQISKQLKIPLRTLERTLKKLKDDELIEFKGAPKTGGYYTK